MEKICQIILADSIEQMPSQNGAVVNRLNQPVLSFRLPFLPSALSFHIMVILVDFEIDKGFEFGYKITDENQGIINEQLIQKIPPITQQFDNFNISIDVKNATFMEPGTYTVQIQINEDIFTQPFLLRADRIFEYKDEN